MSTSALLANLPDYDGAIPFGTWKRRRQQEIKQIVAAGSAQLARMNKEGKPLYRVNESGNIQRTKPLSKSTKALVIERDRVCVQCGSGAPFEVDHIVRYADGGSNDPINLQTLCETCHGAKGGR